MNKVPDPMPDIVAEQMSAWLDDELPEAEIDMLAARLGRSPEAHRRLGRYGLIGAALRGGPHAPDAWQLGERVSRALDAVGQAPLVAEPPPAVTHGHRRWQDSVVPFAAAATVLLTLFLMATIKSPALVPVAVTQEGRAGSFMPVAVDVDPRRLQGFPLRTPLSRQRLTDYLVLHGEYTGTLAVQVSDSHIVNDRSYVAAGFTRSGYPAK